MEDTTIIKVNEIPRAEWRNELVLTTAQLAEYYETATDNLHRNFSNNRDRFVEGKHYFKLEGDTLQSFRKNFPEALDKFAPLLYLWTKRGAARHAKMLNTDRAWEVFEALEDNYFDRPANPHSELAAIERDKLAVERDKLAVERERLAFEREKLAFERDKLAFERDKLAFERDKLAFERDKLAFERDKLAFERDKLAVERDKLAFERDKFAVENDEDAKIFEAVQTLRELASAAGDEKYMRSKLVWLAANLLVDKNFIEGHEIIFKKCQ